MRLQFDVSVEACAKELDRAYKQKAKQIRMPGFRVGKVPVRKVKAHLRPQVIHEVSEVVIDKAYRQALANENIRPVGAPQVDGHPHIHEGKPFRFSITVEVRPEIELAAVSGLKVSVDAFLVSDEDHDKEMTRLRRLKASHEAAPEGCEAAAEHRVAVTFSASIEGEELVADQSETFDLSDESLEEGIKSAILGQKVGVPFEAEIDFSETNQNPALVG